MKVLVVAALLCFAFARPSQEILAPLLGTDYDTAIKGEYIVVLKNQVSDSDVELHRTKVRSLMKNSTAIINHEWQIGKSFRGYAGVMDERLVNEIRGMEEVKYVEQNQIVTVAQSSCDMQKDTTWGLVRTTVHDWNTNPIHDEYKYNKADGSGVTIYIIDSGIDYTHPLFEGRAERGPDFIDDPPPPEGDPNGHGTHVAGTVIADLYGLARAGTAVSVRVANASGSGTTATIIDGVHYVSQQAGPGKKTIANMSLGSARLDSVNDAVNECVKSGVHITVSAGNNVNDACLRSPASAEMVVTVTSSTSSDTRDIFSNFGPCVDIIAPGVAIISLDTHGGTISLSGTSMAAPHVAGVMAKILSVTDDYDDPIAMKAYLKSIATKDKIEGFPTNPPTDNDLVFFDCK